MIACTPNVFILAYVIIRDVSHAYRDSVWAIVHNMDTGRRPTVDMGRVAERRPAEGRNPVGRGPAVALGKGLTAGNLDKKVHVYFHVLLTEHVIYNIAVLVDAHGRDSM